MNKTPFVVGVFIGFLLGILIGFLIGNYKRNQNLSPIKTEIFDSKIDSIIIKKDSLIQRVDTITKEIEKIKIQYEKDIDVIRYNSTDENVQFFSDYIRENRERLDSSINFGY